MSDASPAPSVPPPRSTGVQLLGLAGWIAVCFAAAAFGALASIDAASFYRELVRPPWAPPAGLFGPVWSALYLAMAVAAWLVWRERPRHGTGRALALFAAQLVANALWSWLFFAWRLGGPAFVEVLVLWSLIACTVVAFWRIRPIAAVLLLPYLAWVTFASWLNWTLWQANPGLLG